MKRLRGKLTYANVVSTLCLCLLVGGGTAFAANQLAKNSVGPKQLKKNAVTTAKIKNGAVTGAKIQLSSLGAVPSAANAQTLGGLTSTQITEASKLKCPSDMVLVAGTCVETAARAPDYLTNAMVACGKANRALPSMGQLIAYGVQHAAPEPPFEWAGQLYFDGAVFRGAAVLVDKGGEDGISTEHPAFNSLRPYRCVQGPSN